MIGGYLGAGKTTLLNALLSDPGGRRIGVIVNDFGELGVDASLISAVDTGSTPVANLANGCVCCTLGDDLGTTLLEMSRIEPALDHIVIEASGVADPRSVAAWGTVAPFVPGGTIVLAAADGVQRMSEDRYVGGEVLRQLVGADLVILTKSDLVDMLATERVQQWLTGVTKAPVLAAPMGAIDIDIVLGTRSADTAAQSREVPAAADDLYVRWTWRQSGPVTRRSLDAFVADLPPGLLRLKGVVEVRSDDGTVTTMVQVVGSAISTNEVEDVGLRGIEAIGIRDLFDPGRIERSALKYLQPE